MDSIDGFLRIDVLESCIITGADELQVGEVAIRSPQDLKAHLVATNGGGGEFWVICLPLQYPNPYPTEAEG